MASLRETTVRITGPLTRGNDQVNTWCHPAQPDRDGQYVRRYVPELAGLDPADIQTPWKLAPIRGYPGPIVELS